MNFVLDNRVQTFELKGESCKRFTFLFDYAMKAASKLLKRNAELGLTGTANLTTGGDRFNQSEVNAGKRDYYRVNPSVSMNYRSGILNLFGDASYNQGNYFSVIKTSRLINNEVFKSINFDEPNYNFRNLRFGADIYATPKTTFGLILRGWGRTGDGNSTSATNEFNQDLTVQTNSFITNNIGNSQRSGYSSNFNFKHDLDAKMGHSFNIDLDYNRFNTNSINDLTIYKNEAKVKSVRNRGTGSESETSRVKVE